MADFNFDELQEEGDYSQAEEVQGDTSMDAVIRQLREEPGEGEGPEDIVYSAQTGSAAGLKGSQSANDCSSGASGGGQKKCKVLCTLAFSKGFLPGAILAADYNQGAKTSEYVKEGYWMWAIPLTRWLDKRPKLFKNVALPFINAWAYQMAYREGVHPKFNFLGLAMECIATPICYILGYLKVKILRK